MKRRRLRKLLSMILAVVMTLGICGSALAADTISISNLSGHTFTAYQIFTGTQKDGSTALGDIQWGDGIDSTKFLSALASYTYDTDNDGTEEAIFENCSTAQDVADILDDYANDSEVARAFAALAVDCIISEKGISITEGTSSLLAGYYLIVDTTASLDDGDAYNAALLQVTGSGTIEITKKTDSPTVDKSVNDADTYIGGTVTFTLTGSVPDMTYYSAYKYVFHDTLSPSLKYVDNTLKVYGVSASGVKTNITSSFTVDTGNYSSDNGTTITVSIDNLKGLDNISSYTQIVVEYNATLESTAIIGQTDVNKNNVYLEYSNNPDNNGTGNTPTDTVYVFTYELDGTKVDASSYDTDSDSYSTKLSNAEFVLYYEESGTKYYVVLDTNNKVTGWTTYYDGTESGYTSSDEIASTITSDADGKFSVIGLDAGTYYLEETKAPAGYNLLSDPIKIKITASLSASDTEKATGDSDVDTIDSLTIAVNDGTPTNGNKNTGVVEITVENNSGSVLPSTGGIGTTIFYIVGGILVIGAAILLVTKKRLDKTE